MLHVECEQPVMCPHECTPYEEADGPRLESTTRLLEPSSRWVADSLRLCLTAEVAHTALLRHSEHTRGPEQHFAATAIH